MTTQSLLVEITVPNGERGIDNPKSCDYSPKGDLLIMEQQSKAKENKNRKY